MTINPDAANGVLEPLKLEIIMCKVWNLIVEVFLCGLTSEDTDSKMVKIICNF